MKFKFYNLVIVVITFTCINFSASFAGTIHSDTEIQIGSRVIPTAYSTTPGTATFLGPLANAARTYQLLIHESELTGLAGGTVEGLTFRLPVSATASWPIEPTTFTNFDIYLSGSVTPADRSLTFANNAVGVQRLVRSGSLIIPVNSFPSGGSPNPFGEVIDFDSSYLYSGGHLLIEIRHSGFAGNSRSVDAIGTSVSGYGTLFSACWTGSYTGTAGSQGNFSVVSLNTGGIVGINPISQSPSQFMLKQNYPNPFNPVTKIEYDLPFRSIVNISVFDLTGKKVGTLVNEIKNAGYYHINFDGSLFSSGVYTYRMNLEPLEGQSGDRFTITRKMIIIK